MNAIELLLPGGAPSGIWFCTACKNVRATKGSAEECCICGVCKKPLDGVRDWAHPDCKKAYQAEKYADLVGDAVKLETWDGWVHWEIPGCGGKEFFESVQELAETCDLFGVARPAFVFVCEEQAAPEGSTDDIIEVYRNEGYEEIECDIQGETELAAAIKAFNEANSGLISYRPDHKRMVRVPQTH
jgi:hypothetical protein